MPEAALPDSAATPPWASSALDVCAACGEALSGRFCSACGERRPSPDDERLGPFLRDQFHEVTSADGKLWRTGRALFVPGRLTEEYFAGRRGRYVRPVRIFLVANVLFFLTLTAIGANSIFQGRAETQRTALIYGTWASRHLDRASASSGATDEVYLAAFDRRSRTLANSLVGVMVPVLALVFALVLRRRRASGVRHLVFATHYLSFAMAGSIGVAAVWLPVVFLANRYEWVASGHWLRGTMDPVISVVLVGYLWAALRRAYGLRWWTAGVATAVVIGAGVPFVITVYRFVLFVVALWTTEVTAV